MTTSTTKSRRSDLPATAVTVKSKPEENRGTLARSWDSKMADSCRQTPKIWNTPREDQNLEFYLEEEIWPLRNLRNAKSLSIPSIAMHGIFWELRTLPKFLFGDELTSRFYTWRGLTQRVSHKILGTAGTGNMSYKFLKFPIISLWENHPWERRCWLSGVRGSCKNFVIRENFPIFECRV